MLFILSSYGVLSVSGANAVPFLQGQLTIDIEALSPLKSSLCAHCNPKGRIISLFYLLRRENDFLLIMQKDLLPIASKALQKYAAFYKVVIADMTHTLPLFGCDIVDLTQLPPPFITIPIDPSRRLIVGHSPAANQKLGDVFSASAQSEDAWHIRHIEKGIPTLVASTSEKFLPHELALPALSAVSFNKGCFTGQEIIARMQYRGQTKKLLTPLCLSQQSSYAPGDTVTLHRVDDTKHVCGTIINAHPLNNHQHSVLALIDNQSCLNFDKEAPSNAKFKNSTCSN